MSSSDDAAAAAKSTTMTFRISAERRRAVATQFCLRRWWPMSLILGVVVATGSGLALGPAVVLSIIAAAIAAGTSYVVEWMTIGRAFVEVRHGGHDAVRNRFRQRSGTLSPPIQVAPLDGTWSTPGVRMVMADSSGRGATPVSAVALDPERDVPALIEALGVSRRDYP